MGLNNLVSEIQFQNKKSSIYNTSPYLQVRFTETVKMESNSCQKFNNPPVFVKILRGSCLGIVIHFLKATAPRNSKS